MTTIQKVGSSIDPDDYRDAEERNVRPLPSGVAEGHYFDARIPANSITNVRRAARERQYPNSTVEADTIRAVDDEMFEKVRNTERYTVARAEAFLERGKGRAGAALAHLDTLESLQDRLRAGEDTSTIAKEFKALERTIRSREVTMLRGMATEVESLDADLADPVAHAERILSLMPIAFGRTAGLV